MNRRKLELAVISDVQLGTYGCRAKELLHYLKSIDPETLVLNGDISFTKRWKLASTINFDMINPQITNARFTLSRNMHCWALSFYWTPIGGNKSFLFSIRNTSSMFQDAKIDIRKPPVFL